MHGCGIFLKFMAIRRDVEKAVNEVIESTKLVDHRTKRWLINGSTLAVFFWKYQNYGYHWRWRLCVQKRWSSGPQILQWTLSKVSSCSEIEGIHSLGVWRHSIGTGRGIVTAPLAFCYWYLESKNLCNIICSISSLHQNDGWPSGSNIFLKGQDSNFFEILSWRVELIKAI